MGKIYTRKGDRGKTSTLAGKISKADDLAEALGSIDELNCWIGVCRYDIENPISKELRRIQENLMTIMSVLAGSKLKFKAYETVRLEKFIDKLTKELPPLSGFIYPTGYLQAARAICRRAERRVVAVQETEGKIEGEYKQILKYLNRLSDALFVMGRAEERKKGRKEEKWKMGF